MTDGLKGIGGEHAAQPSARGASIVSLADETCAAESCYRNFVPRASLSLADQFDIASFGELTSDPSRVRILLTLMDGRMRPAGELSRIAGVSASTTSAHLKKLVLGGLLAQRSTGRHRYYALANDEVAEALEALGRLRAMRRTTRERERTPFHEARTCWRHVAGRFGVAVFSALESRRLLAISGAELALTERGIAFYQSLGAELTRRPSGKACVDLTERRIHLGGALGTLLTARMFALEWISRTDDEGRTLRVTTRGRRELARQLSLEWP